MQVPPKTMCRGCGLKDRPNNADEQNKEGPVTVQKIDSTPATISILGQDHSGHDTGGHNITSSDQRHQCHGQNTSKHRVANHLYSKQIRHLAWVATGVRSNFVMQSITTK